MAYITTKDTQFANTLRCFPFVTRNLVLLLGCSWAPAIGALATTTRGADRRTPGYAAHGIGRAVDDPEDPWPLAARRGATKPLLERRPSGFKVNAMSHGMFCRHAMFCHRFPTSGEVARASSK